MSESVPVKIVNDNGSALVDTSWLIQEDGSVIKMYKTYSSGVLFSDDLSTAYIYNDPRIWKGNEWEVRYIKALAFHTHDENLTYMVLLHHNLQYYVFVAHRIDSMLSKENDGTYTAPCSLAGLRFKKFGYRQLDSGYYLFVAPDGVHLLNSIGSLNRVSKDFVKDYLLRLCNELDDISLFCTIDGKNTVYVFMKEKSSTAGVLLPLEECLYTDYQSFNYQKLANIWRNRQLTNEAG